MPTLSPTLSRGVVIALLVLPAISGASTDSTHAHAMQMDTAGVVMHQNTDNLPRDCQAIAQDYQFTVHAGQKYAAGQPGMIFAMSQHEIQVAPCSRIEITFVNEDAVRHQWMVHGLPRYLYPAGMFHIEAEGGQRKTGTFIVPSEDRNYLIHCDMAQHMEKGMRGQLVVGAGSGDLWGVAGVSDKFNRDAYLPGNLLWWIILAGMGGAVLTAVMISFRRFYNG